jgi:hypothetical protein
MLAGKVPSNLNASGIASSAMARRKQADYIVSLTDDGFGAGRKGRRAVVFTPSGDLIFANSARSLKNAVKDACEAIEKNWGTNPLSKTPAVGRSQQ